MILVDGVPGSGKSVVAQTIARRIRQTDQRVRWWYEEELGHAIYLRQRDVAATMRNVLAVRGPGWAQRTIHKAVDSPYGKAHGLDRIEGFDGLTRFWSDYQALEDRLFDRSRLTRSAIDVAVGEWANVESSVCAWLQLPPARAIAQGNLERFVGSYRAPDGSLASVELDGGSLRVRGLHQIWPGQRLIAVGPDAFEVLSLPFTIRFDHRGMQVEGPELLGGRPPGRLERD